MIEIAGTYRRQPYSINIIDLVALEPRHHEQGYKSCPLCYLLFYSMSGNEFIDGPDAPTKFALQYISSHSKPRPSIWMCGMLKSVGTSNQNHQRCISAIPKIPNSGLPYGGRILHNTVNTKLLQDWLTIVHLLTDLAK